MNKVSTFYMTCFTQLGYVICLLLYKRDVCLLYHALQGVASLHPGRFQLVNLSVSILGNSFQAKRVICENVWNPVAFDTSSITKARLIGQYELLFILTNLTNVCY